MVTRTTAQSCAGEGTRLRLKFYRRKILSSHRLASRFANRDMLRCSSPYEIEAVQFLRQANQNKKHSSTNAGYFLFLICAGEGTRTLDLLRDREALYPTKLRPHFTIILADFIKKKSGVVAAGFFNVVIFTPSCTILL